MADRVVRAVITGSSAGAVKAFSETAVASEAAGLKIGKAGEAAGAKVAKGFESSMASSIPGFAKFGPVIANPYVLAGAAVVGVTATIVGVTTDMAAKFQKSMTLLETGAGEAHDKLGMVNDGILAMAAKVGIMPEELAKGMYLIESAGYHGAAGLEVLRTAAEGAKVGGADMATVANALTSALNAYHEPASSAVSITNQMIATVGAGKMKMQDLATAMSNVLPTAAAAKLSFAEIGGAIATMTGQGTSADQASQNLANTIRALQNPTSVAVKEMAAMGLNATDVASHLGSKGLTGTLGELVSAITAHMGPAGLVLQSSFNQSKAAMADANTMLKQLPVSVQHLAQGFLNNTVTAAEWRKALKAMPAETANLAKEFATTAKDATGFNDLLRSGGPAAQTFSAALSDVTGGATGLSTSLQLTGSNFDTFTANVKAVAAAGKAGGNEVTGFARTQQDLGSQMDKAKAGLSAFGITIGEKLLPVITTVVSFFNEKVLPALTVALPIAFAIVGRYVSVLATIFTIQFNIVRAVIERIVVIIQVAVGVIAKVIGGVATVIGGVVSVVSGVVSSVVGVISGMVTFFEALPGRIVTALGDLGGKLADLFSGAFHRVSDTVTGWIGTVVGFFHDMPGHIADAFKDLGGAIAGAFSGAFNAVAGVVKGVVNTVIGWINDFIGLLDSFQIHMHIPEGVPLIGGKGFDWGGLGIPKIPKLDTGGVVSKPTLALLAMNSQPEVVAPLSTLRGGGGMAGHSGQIIYIDKLTVVSNDPNAVVKALKQYQTTNGSLPVTVRQAVTAQRVA